MSHFTFSLDESLAKERGVRYGQLNLVAVDIEGGHQHIHSHLNT